MNINGLVGFRQKIPRRVIRTESQNSASGADQSIYTPQREMKRHPITENPLAFPYQPPSSALVDRFQYIFREVHCLRHRRLKRCTDILFSVVALILTAPFYPLVATLIWVDGLFHPENAGPLMDPYIAASAGRKFLKLKFRTLKWSNADTVSCRLDFSFRPSEHVDQNLTFVRFACRVSLVERLPGSYPGEDRPSIESLRGSDRSPRRQRRNLWRRICGARDQR